MSNIASVAEFERTKRSQLSLQPSFTATQAETPRQWSFAGKVFIYGVSHPILGRVTGYLEVYAFLNRRQFEPKSASTELPRTLLFPVFGRLLKIVHKES